MVASSSVRLASVKQDYYQVITGSCQESIRQSVKQHDKI